MLPFLFFLCVLPDPDPLGADLASFPPLPVCESAVSLNRAYIDYLDRTAPTMSHRRDWFLAARDEAVEARAVWEALLEARKRYCDWDSEHRYPIKVEDREAGLERLKHFLGDERYFMGAMPFPVPVQRFRRLE